MKLNPKIERIKDWVVKNKTLALSLPVIIILCTFFVVENIKGFREISASHKNQSGYNTSIPQSGLKETTGLEEEALWQERGNIEKVDKDNEMNSPKLIVRNQQQDSLKRVLEELEELSFDPNKHSNQLPVKTYEKLEEPEKSGGHEEEKDKREQLEERLNYTQLLREGKEKMLESGSSGPPSIIGKPYDEPKTKIQVKAKIYRDQFILPAERVQLILTEGVSYKGNFLPKNTFFYAMAKVQGNRVLLEVDNINHIPINADVRDLRDGMPGVYSKRAGELWNEYVSNIQAGASDQITQQLGNEFDGKLNLLVKGLGSFLERKRLRERDKILLINGHQLLMNIE